MRSYPHLEPDAHLDNAVRRRRAGRLQQLNGKCPRQGFGLIDASLASRYLDEPAEEGSERYRGRFQLVDAATGEPIPNQAVRVRSTGGQYLTGTTDAEGYTQWVERDVREALAFDLVQDGVA